MLTLTVSSDCFLENPGLELERAIKEITRVHTDRGVTSVVRTADGVEITDVHGDTATFDHVVFATHADVTLSILGDAATSDERRILSAFRYDRNEVVLHTDVAAMPQNRRVWSAWNGIERNDDDGSNPVSVSYWMNRLQNIDTDTDLIVTLNPGDSVDPSKVVDRWVAMHPQFDVHTDAAQAEIPTIQGSDRIWFAGAHLGYGFHEDAVRSACICWRATRTWPSRRSLARCTIPFRCVPTRRRACLSRTPTKNRGRA